MRKSLWTLLTVLLVAIGAPGARADTVDLNPNDGIISPNGGGCTTPPYPAPCSTDTVGGFVLLSYFTPIQTLLVNNLGAPFTGTWFLESGTYFQQTDIYLVGGGTFTVVSFSAGGCNGTLNGLNAAGVAIPGDSFEFITVVSAVNPDG